MRIFMTRVAALIAMILAAQSTLAAEVRDIYPPAANASEDIAVAFKLAMTTHKRLILDFGGNWCPDCRVLDSFFNDDNNKPLLEESYLLVHVNVEHMTENLDLADKFQVPLKKGVPALAVIDENGNLVYSQKAGQFQAMRSMQTASVTEFLVRWKSPNVVH